MATWIWIVIGVGAVALLAFLLFGGRRAREKRIVHKREQAQELRQEAEAHTRRAEEREAVAREQAKEAQTARKEAAAVSERAARVDPDRDDG